jgi:hypothetical protein
MHIARVTIQVIRVRPVVEGGFYLVSAAAAARPYSRCLLDCRPLLDLSKEENGLSEDLFTNLIFK